jgi:acyl-coenzyme A thioesterase 13
MSSPTPDPPPGFRPSGFAAGFLDHGGPYWVRRDDAGHVLGLRVREHHLNYQNVAHGGVLTTFADVALSYCVHVSERPPPPLATATLTVNFLGAARLGDWLEAEAQIDRMGKRLAYVSGVIRRGEEALATMSGVFSVRRASARPPK